MRLNTLEIVLALVLATQAVAEPIKLDHTKHPITRRTLRQGFKAPESGPIKLALFDADSTLRVSLSGTPSANHDRDVMLLPQVAQRILDLNEQGFVVGIVSNQAGIPKHVSLEQSAGAISYCIHLLNERGATVDYFDIAENRDRFRKPDTGMGNLCAQVVTFSTGREIDWANSIMVGDSAWTPDQIQPDGKPGIDHSSADRGFAENLEKEHPGFKFIYAAVFFGWNEYGVRRFDKAQEVRDFLEKYPDLR